MQNYRFAPLVPEYKVSDIHFSLRFWCDGLGFKIAYDRPEQGFAYLKRGELQVMLDSYDSCSRWNIGAMEPPLGQGINVQMFVPSLDPMLTSLRAINWPLYMEPEDKWYRIGDVETGNRQFLVQDPDGYLLRFVEDLGTRTVVV